MTDSVLELSVAEMMNAVWVVGAVVVSVTCALVAPAGMVTVAGRVANSELELRFTK